MIVTDVYKNRGWTVVVDQPKKLEWNVFYYDINRKKINTYNIFEHGGFVKWVQKDLKDVDNIEDFAKTLESNLQYFFWAKAEHEILITSWVGGDREKDAVKIDIYSQVMLNWEIFLEYVWSNKELLKVNRYE